MANMPRKRPAKKSKATPYVKQRVKELAAAHGWDPEHVEGAVTQARAKKARK
jgi:hypothetical protein